MGKKSTLCAYCGIDLSTGPVNREHFVAKCFWGGLPLPQFVEVIRIHESCNTGGKDDAEYLRNILVMASGTREHPNARRALDGPILKKIARSPKETQELLGEVGMMPVTTPSGIFVEMAEAFRVDQDRKNRALHNIIRGLFFLVEERPLAIDAVFHELDGPVGEMLLPGTEMSESFGDDVFQYRYRVFVEDPNCMLVFLRFYQRHTFGFVTISKGFKMPLDDLPPTL